MVWTLAFNVLKDNLSFHKWEDPDLNALADKAYSGTKGNSWILLLKAHSLNKEENYIIYRISTHFCSSTIPYKSMFAHDFGIVLQINYWIEKIQIFWRIIRNPNPPHLPKVADDPLIE